MSAFSSSVIGAGTSSQVYGGALIPLNPPSFPRPNLQPISGFISGRIRNPQGLPLVSKRVVVYAKVAGFLVSMKFHTDERGCFLHGSGKLKSFTARVTHKSDARLSIWYDVFERNPNFIPGENVQPKYIIVSENLEFTIKNSSKGVVLPNDLIVDYYQVKPNLPDHQPPSNSDLNPQRYPYFLFNLSNLDLSNLQNLIGAFKFLISKYKNFNSIEEVQEQCRGNYPRIPLCQETTIALLTKGICTIPLKKEKDGTFLATVDFTRYEKKETPELYNMTIKLEKNSDGKLSIISITEHHQNGIDSVVINGDIGFDRMLYKANCMLTVWGQAVEHLIKGHFIPGMFATAMFPSFSQKTNPLFKSSKAHFRNTIPINNLGGPLIFLKGSVLDHTGFKSEGVMQLFAYILGSMPDYANFRVRPELGPDDLYSRLGQLWWRIIDKAERLRHQKDREEILKHWNEFYNFSNMMVKISCPYLPYDGSEDRDAWHNPYEISDPNITRVVMDGVIKSFVPITLNPEAPEPADPENGILGGEERLIRCFVFYKWFSIFHHHFTHRGGKTSSTDLQFSTIAPTKGAMEPLGGTKIKDGVIMLETVNVILNTITSKLMENEHGDVDPFLISAIHEYLPEFIALHEDPMTYPEGTDI